MNKTALFACMAFFSMTVVAKDKDKASPLPQSAVGPLSGKMLAVTRHEAPGFYAMTAGKAGFGLLGVAAMYSAGKEIVTTNEVADPAGVIEQELAPAIAKQFSMQLKAGPGTVIKGKTAKDVAAAHADADYVLDVQSSSWNFAYYAKDWNNYWLGYSVQVRLFDVKAGRELSKMACYTDTQAHPTPPSRDSLLANKAQLLKDVTASLGWTCLKRIATKEFNLPAEAIAAPPAELADPLTAHVQHQPGGAVAASAPAVSP